MIPEPVDNRIRDYESLLNAKQRALSRSKEISKDLVTLKQWKDNGYYPELRYSSGPTKDAQIVKIQSVQFHAIMDLMLDSLRAELNDCLKV